MNILVIGGTGFIGPPLVHVLRDQGHALAVLHRGNPLAAAALAAIF
jgi:nucleoside-diphosphate-sugar epimerase